MPFFSLPYYLYTHEQSPLYLLNKILSLFLAIDIILNWKLLSFHNELFFMLSLLQIEREMCQQLFNMKIITEWLKLSQRPKSIETKPNGVELIEIEAKLFYHITHWQSEPFCSYTYKNCKSSRWCVMDPKFSIFYTLCIPLWIFDQSLSLFRSVHATLRSKSHS